MTRTISVALALALVGAAGGTSWWLATPRHGAPAQADVPVSTTAVVRTTLTTTTQLSGTLGYAGSYTVISQVSGTITALPVPGTVIGRGQHVFEVDGAPVHLFDGPRPAWRAFALGMTRGPDVEQLERNLAALGYGTDLLVDDTFTWGTDAAVRRWQDATGQRVTGRIDLGRIAFQPTAIRILASAVAVGATAQPGEAVLTASTPNPVVTVAVPATQTYLVHPGDRVTITMPSGSSTTGRVTALSAIADQPNDSGDNRARPNEPPLATVPAVIALDRPAVAAHLDQAPVTVDVTDRRINGVLAVPVTSLVALAGGGFAVWVDRPAERHLTAVTPGLFANTLVQVSSPTLKVGDLVEVPAP